MIIDLPATTTAAINKKLVDIRGAGGVISLSRVLTLVIVTDDIDAEASIEAANEASREHPCRVIVVARGNRRGTPRLDGQIRVGGDAGASEVIVLRLTGKLADHGASVVVPLLLPDTPVVSWWPGQPPKDPGATPIGAMAHRRITDSGACHNPARELQLRREHYRSGDTDLAWTRITLWRALLAAALDEPPYERVSSATVVGGSDSPSADLLAAWLAEKLRCPVTRARARRGEGLVSVRLERRSGPVDLVRPDGNVATIVQPGQPDRRVALQRRSTTECLAEELRRLDPDEIYEETLVRGLPRLAPRRKAPTGTEAGRTGQAMPRAEARRRATVAKKAAATKATDVGRAEPADRPPKPA